MVRPGIRRLFRLTRFRAENTRDAVREELAHHLEASMEHLRHIGFSESEARAEALRRLGPLEEVEQRLYNSARKRERRMQLREWLDAIGRDFRYAGRGLRREPALTAVIVLTLALGIGANAAIFPMLDRLLFRPPSGVQSPSDVQRVYVAERRDQGRIEIRDNYTFPEVEDIRAGMRSVSPVGAYLNSAISVDGDTAAERRVGLAYVSAELLPLLGVRMSRGRHFSMEEVNPSDPRLIAIISDAVWRTRFGAAPDIVGKKVRLGSRQFTVVGVTAPEFNGIDVIPTGVWLPLSNQRMIFSRNGPWWTTRSVIAWKIVVRTPQNIREAAALRAVRSFSDGIAAAGQPDREPRILLGSIITGRGPQETPPGQAIATRLAGVSVILLLIAIANVTNLLIARATRRQREVAVRRALGISRRRLMTGFVVESALFATLAGLTAATCSVLIAGVVRSLVLPDVSWTPPPLDTRAVVFTTLLAGVCALVAGLIPALHVARAQPYPLLTTRYAGERSGWLRSTLLTAQAALSAILLVGAGLFITSLQRVQQIDAGYELNPLAAVSALANGDVRAAYTMARDRIADRSDVQSVALASVPPLRGLGGYDTYLPGRDSALAEGFAPDINGVSPEFFQTTGLRILRGRGFSADDRHGSAPVMVVNQEAARVLWPSQDALGACVRLQSKTGLCYTVIGIAQNTPRFRILEDPPLQAYVPLEQLPDRAPPRVLLIRGRTDPSAAGELAAAELASRFGPRSSAIFYYRDWLEPQLATWKLGARLLSTVAGLSLLLAIVGLYSVLAYSVTQRAHELGVRMALGAGVARVVHTVLAQGGRALVLGILLGLALAAAAGKLIAALLYNTSTIEPTVYLAVAITLLAAGGLASVVPAVRAARIDPVRSLRAD